jgi:3-dehydroquinate dehydratase/shikimate dehydrogenase
VSGTVVHSLLEATPEAVARELAGAPEACGFVELRADRLRAAEVAGLVRRAGRPVIVTVRSTHDGGRFEGSTEEKRAILAGALEAGASFVDVEWNGPLRAEAGGSWAPRVILSHHGAACDARILGALYDAMATTRAARLKIVPHARRVNELIPMRELLARARRPLACFASGDAGVASRVLALAWGSWATYGSAASGRETAPGQPASSELLATYRVLELSDATRRFALAGSPVLASPSPVLHAAGYREAGLDAVYLPLDTGAVDDLAEAAAPGGLALEGFGVTVPLKEQVAARCASLDPYGACGAVNTVVTAGGWAGFNTDAPAALRLIGRHVALAGASVAVVGAGGTARAIAAACVREGAVVTLFNRTPSRGEAAARATGAAAAPLAALPGAAWDVLIQATPLGREGEGVLPDRALAGAMVLDAAYGMATTPLVAQARRRGLAVADGFDLLAAQAALQFERLTGHAVDASVFDAAIEPWRLHAGA